MGHLCSNYLIATGTDEQLEMLKAKIGDMYEIVDTEFETELEIWFDSNFRFPHDQFRAFTQSFQSTEGLYIRVASDEHSTEYLEQSIFSDGSWNFDNKPTINALIHELTSEGLDKIRKKLAANNNKINVSDNIHWTVLYTDIKGKGQSAFLEALKLEIGNAITLILSNGVRLVEDEITTNHVLDILYYLFDKEDNNK